jgi:hypothetical protein
MSIANMARSAEAWLGRRTSRGQVVEPVVVRSWNLSWSGRDKIVAYPYLRKKEEKIKNFGRTRPRIKEAR